MEAKFLAHNKGELKQRQRRQQQEWQKSNRIILLAKQQLFYVHQAFLYIS